MQRYELHVGGMDPAGVESWGEEITGVCRTIYEWRGLEYVML